MDSMTLKRIIAQNISEYRREAGLTQAELAERLNYSDKAVSKWERGESIPDILVLKTLADLFGVTVDALISEKTAQTADPAGPAPEEQPPEIIPSGSDTPAVPDDQADGKPSRPRRKAGPEAVRSITAVSIVTVWLIATATFVMLDLFLGHAWPHTLPFLCALPVSLVIWLVLNSVFNGGKRLWLIASMLLWAVLLAVHLSLLCFRINVWQVYLIGVPAQAVVLICRMLVNGIRKGRTAGNDGQDP